MEDVEKVHDSISQNISRSVRMGDWSTMEEDHSQNQNSSHAEEDEEALKWAALEKLPTYARLRTSIIKSFVESMVVHKEVDVRKLDLNDRTQLIDSLFRVPEEDNEKFLKKFRNRTEKVGIILPTVEVRFENLTIEADCYIGDRALPTLPNAALNIAEMTLLLGPPSSGKTTLLLALAGKLDPTLKVRGEVTYNGHRLNEFVPQKTSAYISQNDVHVGEMTVKETLNFSARCQGVGFRYELLTELARRERDAGIFPEAEVDLFMKATALEGVESNLIIDYTLRMLGLDVCRDTIVGDGMQRGISGGQKKRVTTGEMIVGSAKTLFMDEISTGLDSSTTFQIVKCLQQIAHLTEATILMSLLQPALETFDLFDDIILLSEGQIVYQGPREHILEFFQSCGFNCPQRKGTADFLQEVTARKDQEQYWADTTKPYRYISVTEFASRFKRFHAGLQLKNELSAPYDKAQSHAAALVYKKYPVPMWELLKASFDKEWLLIKRNSFVFFKQLLVVFLLQQMAAGLFRLIAGVGQIPKWWEWGYWVSPVTYGFNALAVNEMFAPRWMNKLASDNVTRLGVKVLKNLDVFAERNWLWIGAAALLGFVVLFNILFTLALMYLNPLGKPQAIISKETAMAMEAHTEETKEAPRLKTTRLKIGSAADGNNPREIEIQQMSSQSRVNGRNEDSSREVARGVAKKRGMILPFTPLSLSFDCLNYFVDMPPEMREQGVTEDKLQLLQEATGAFRPGVLTALMGVSGAGKTTLMDVLAGRKTGGYIEGNVMISGFPKKQESFARISGYCEQNDIHSPQVTVHESLIYSAFLRLPKEVKMDEKMLVLMKRGGQLIYSGPLGRNSHKIIEYFEAIPGVPRIKERYNPATWMLEVSSVAAEVQLGIDFSRHYKSSALYQLMLSVARQAGPVDPTSRLKRNKGLVQELSAPPPGAKDLYFPTQFSQSTWGQFKSCLWKQWCSYWRSPAYNLARFFFALGAALVSGTIFWKVGAKRDNTSDLETVIGAMFVAVLFVGVNNCKTVQPLVAVERTVVYRERAAGMYSALPYALAQVIVEIPYVLVQASYFVLIVYAMVDFEWTAPKFFWFFFITYISFLYFTYFGMMTVSITPNNQVAAIVASAFFTLFILFSGFFIPRSRIPKWWIWYYRICPLAWTVYGLIVSQYGDIVDTIKVPGVVPDPTVKWYLEHHFGYEPNFIGPVAGVLVSFTVFFAFMYAYCIKTLNFQRR
ncbi:hypothetical protein RHMOL_Rhmol12G0236900 [Rhododendron molle]|uniref:Uncharacterized protein n=1 Tax=Rhododendron molle TaxID=49168 RepID=A0ACC0LM33_RHOML|nr:hypothetical protein RHMOL_Rhmol12G0236900 [Rhododendron molle]